MATLLQISSLTATVRYNGFLVRSDMDYCWYVRLRNVSCPVSGPERLKPTEFPNQKIQGGTLFYVNEMTLGMFLKRGLVSEEPTDPSWNFHSLPHPTYREKGAGDWVQSMIYSIAPCHQKAGFRQLPSWWTLGGLGEWHPQRSWKSHALFPGFALCISSTWLILNYVLYHNPMI